jgi:folate-dependent phosphoribosylglycinamide formyltransferase PurN
VITGDGLEHRYVANKLAAVAPLAGIVVDHGKQISAIENVRKYFRRYTTVQLLSRVWLALLRKAWGNRANRLHATLSILGRENCREFLHPELLHHVNGINSPEGVRAVAALEPDVILVYGTGIVGGKVLSLARTIALNMHTGISPYYRGCDCAFWPLYNQELHMLGATVHECVKEVDGGRIFGTTGIHLHAGDDLFAVFERCVAAGADLYVKKVQELLEHGLEGKPQDFSIGMEYKAILRDARAERKVRRSIREGMIRRYVESNQEQNDSAPIAVAK